MAIGSRPCWRRPFGSVVHILKENNMYRQICFGALALTGCVSLAFAQSTKSPPNSSATPVQVRRVPSAQAPTPLTLAVAAHRDIEPAHYGSPYNLFLILCLGSFPARRHRRNADSALAMGRLSVNYFHDGCSSRTSCDCIEAKKLKRRMAVRR